MGLDDGHYMAFDERGRPWGVLRFGDGDVTIEAPPAPAPNTIDQGYRRDFAEYLIGECNLTAATAFTYETSFQRIEKWFGGRDVSTLTVEEVRRFIRESSYHPSTKNGTLVAIKALHRWAEIEGLPWANPAIQRLRGPKQVRDPRRALEIEEAVTLLDSCRSSNEFRAVYLGLYGGLRVSEQARIGEPQWLPDRLRFEGAKNRKTRDVPMHPELADKRAIILSKSPSKDTLKHVCRSLSFVTGVDFTSHTLRRTFSRTMRRGGVPREVPAAIMGHTPATVNESSYDPVEWDEMVDGMSKLDYRALAEVTR